jgi:hypothetical protein
MATKKRDGFAIIEMDTRKEVHFVACTHDGRLREKVMNGLLLKTDTDRFIVADTRDDK